MAKKVTKMVSLDTSSRASGWAYWENGNLTDYGVFDYSKMKDKEARLDTMCISLCNLLKEHKPDIIVIEMTVVEKNAGTQRLLSEIVGVVRGWHIITGASEFVRLRPTEWRKLVREEDEKLPKSKDDGLKNWDIAKANALFGLSLKDDNIADAILIGYARIRQFQNS